MIPVAIRLHNNDRKVTTSIVCQCFPIHPYTNHNLVGFWNFTESFRKPTSHIDNSSFFPTENSIRHTRNYQPMCPNLQTLKHCYCQIPPNNFLFVPECSGGACWFRCKQYVNDEMINRISHFLCCFFLTSN